ncbi:hypothetical protein P9112_014296 [Eukaryota sp. TZLM1-RC]
MRGNTPIKVSPQLKGILGELCVKAIENVDDSIRSDVVKLLKLVQKAHWDYMDNYWPKHKNLPPLTRFFQFAKTIHTVSPTLQQCITNWDKAQKKWAHYNANCARVKLILLNQERSRFLMVKSTRGNPDFVGGKLNEEETPIDCIIREAEEELGVDVAPFMSEDRHHEHNDNHFFIGLDFDESTHLSPITKGEISGYEWVEVSKLPQFIVQPPRNAEFLIPVFQYLLAFLSSEAVVDDVAEVVEDDFDCLIDRIQNYQIDCQHALSVFRTKLAAF